MEEEEVHLFDDFVTEDSIYLIESIDVEKKNHSLVDTLINLSEKEQSSVEPKNIEGNSNKECGKDCLVETAVEESYKENEASDTDVDDDDNKEVTSESDEKSKENSKSKINNNEVRRSRRSRKEVVTIVDDSSDKESDFSADEDSSYTPEDEEVERNKYNRRTKSGSKIDDSDESEHSLCNIKIEERDNDFSEGDDTNSLGNEDEEKDDDEAIFETKIEVEYHEVKYENADKAGIDSGVLNKKDTVKNGPSKRRKRKSLKGDKSDGFKASCTHCPKAFSTIYVLKNHLETQHSVFAQKEEHPCPHCDRIFSRMGSKNEHIRLHHGLRVNCPHCQNTYTTNSTLIQHIKSKHGDPSIKKEYECAQCDEKFIEKDSLTQHVNIKHKGYNYICPHCPKAYAYKYGLTQHVESHGDPLQTKCLQCDKIFSTMSNLKRHVEAIHEGFKFSCPHCSKAYTHKLSLVKHLQIVHAVKREYKCRFCDEKFSSRQSRADHIKKEHGSHPHKCPHCPRAFRVGEDLQNHVQRRHVEPLKIKKYRCLDCDIKFFKRKSFIMHMKIKHDRLKFSCPRCPKAFEESIHLKRHIRLQHGNPLQRKKCPYCTKTFAKKGTLKTHVQRKHGDHLISFEML